MTVARKSLLPVANVALGALLGLLALRVTNLYYGKEAYGEFQFALASVGLVYVFADLSMGDAHTKRVSEGMHEGDCFVTYAVFRVASSALFVLMCATFLFLYTVVLGRVITDLGFATIVAVILYYVAKSIQSVASATFDAKLETARSQLGSLIETVVRVGLVVGGAFVFTAIVRGSGPLAGRVPDSALARFVAAHPAACVALGWAIGSVAAAVVLFAYLARSVQRGRFRMSILKSYFAFALPLFLPNSAALIAFFIDRAMIGFFGTNVETGDFAGPRQIVGVIEGVAAAVGLVLFPAISAAAAAGDRDETRGLLDRGSRYLSLAMMPLLVMLAFFPRAILELGLGDKYVDDALVLSILAVTVYFVILSRPYLNFLMGHGHARAAGRVGLVAALLVIGLDLVLVPSDIKSLGLKLAGLKAVGAAIATLVSTVVAYAMLAWETRRLEGHSPRVSAWKHVLAGLLMAGAIQGVVVVTGFEIHRWYSLVLYSALGTVVYALALWALREITARDVAFARDTLHPGEMLAYVRSELWGPRE